VFIVGVNVGFEYGWVGLDCWIATSLRFSQRRIFGDWIVGLPRRYASRKDGFWGLDYWIAASLRFSQRRIFWIATLRSQRRTGLKKPPSVGS
jgi:hypothetical protein